MQSRRILINGVLCIDEARRLTRGETVTVSDHRQPPPPSETDAYVRYVDKHIAIVEKPSGMLTLRPKSELGWSQRRRQQQPTLDEVVALLIARRAAHRSKTRLRPRLPRLYAVHRIDRDTSGLLVFARNEDAQRRIIEQFAQHDAVRKYLAVIPGCLSDQTIRTHLVRDRGDGLRGSTPDNDAGQLAITHVSVLQKFHQFTEIECRLETGRTNQIRIHLAELGHPVCGDIKYRGRYNQPPLEDTSGAPRLALHAAQLKFVHPDTGKTLDFESPWPADLQPFLRHVAGCPEQKRPTSAVVCDNS